jgi:HAD superfamily hydrolase (TIGR01509 family)
MTVHDRSLHDRSVHNRSVHDRTVRERAERLPAAVLWDMDGTLVDTEPYWIEAEFELVGRFGGSWSIEQAHALVGNDLLTSARAIAAGGGVALPAEEIVELLLEGVAGRIGSHVPWRPGARELLEALAAQGVPNALVTMSYRRLAETVVGALPAGMFAVLVTGDEVTRGKPHPEPYLEAARRLGVAPGECVAIEDSPNGVRSAHAAGVPLLAVQHLVPLAAHTDGRVLTSLAGVEPGQLLALAH